MCSLLLFSRQAGAVEDGPILWQQEIASHAPGAAPEIGKAVEVREEGGLKFLSKLDAGTEFLFANETQKAGSSAWIDYVVRLRYREPAGSAVTLVVKARGARGDVAYMQYYVTIRSNGISLLCHGMSADQFPGDPRREASVLFEDLGAPLLPVGEWITAEVSVGEELIRVSVDAGDQNPRVAEFKVFPGTGGTAVLSRVPIDIAEICVREAKEPVAAKP